MMMKLCEMTSKEFVQIMRDSLELQLNDLYNYKEFIDNTQDFTREEIREKMWNQIFPQGRETPNNFFWIIHDANTNKKVGHLWLFTKPEDEILFIGDIFVDEEFRGRGYGTKCLELVEKMGKNKLASNILELHVFKHNPKARKLYLRFGFKDKKEDTTGFTMLKKI